MFGFKQKRRETAKRAAFPQEWLDILHNNVPYFALLAPEEQRELQGHMQVFLAEKDFEACAGLTITDEIRVTIAAQACILLLHRVTDYYPTLRTIFVYPHEYVVDAKRTMRDGTVLDGPEVRLGESWHRGSVVLAWDAVRGGSADIHDGRNVVFHEFAHQLDSESGANEGLPELPRRSMYAPWAEVLGHEYRELIDDIAHHRRTTLRAYGATNPAEFFAVATECFFEKPRALQRKHPELYDQLKQFYEQDPAERYRKETREALGESHE